MFGYASALSTQVPTQNVSDYRVGALLLVTSFLIQKLSGQSTQSPLISSLRDIRRDLVCGRQELKAAIDQIDVALLGLKVHDVLQEEVSTLLKSHSDYRSILRKLNVQTQALASTLPNQPTGEELIVARATLKSIWNDTEGLPPLLSRLREDWKKFEKRALWVGRFLDENIELKTILSKLKKAFEDSHKEQEKFQELYEDLKGRVKQEGLPD